MKTRLQKHGNLSELIEYLLGGTLRERESLGWIFVRGTSCFWGNIYKKEREAVCQSEQPHIGTPSGLVGALTLLIHFNFDWLSYAHLAQKYDMAQGLYEAGPVNKSKCHGKRKPFSQTLLLQNVYRRRFDDFVESGKKDISIKPNPDMWWTMGLKVNVALLQIKALCVYNFLEFFCCQEILSYRWF